jgi:hypothetical protein
VGVGGGGGGVVVEAANARHVKVVVASNCSACHIHHPAAATATGPCRFQEAARIQVAFDKNPDGSQEAFGHTYGRTG